jgi:hypothetical protein
MNVHYVSCFTPGDHAEVPLLAALKKWEAKDKSTPQLAAVLTPPDLKLHLESLDTTNLDVLIIGGHGHPSLSGFWVDATPLRWHDLAFVLRGRLPRSCSFVFYSCDGGYPGVMHIFGRDSGPDFVFGPRISVYARAMTHATIEILNWKDGEANDTVAARGLVDKINAWAAVQYPLDPDHHRFLRVMWCEGANCRHPDDPGGETPSGSVIPLLGWGL